VSGVRLLATFCNQMASPAKAGGVLHFDGPGWLWLPLEELDVPPGGSGGLCGACAVGDKVLVVTQSTPPTLASYAPRTGRFTAKRTLPACVDAHSITFLDGGVFVVSTGTNEILRVSFDGYEFGDATVYWRYPGVEANGDLVHLNGIAASASGLIASCFGQRLPDGSWGNDGSVFRVEPFELIRGGLSHPHTPLVHDDWLFFAESRRGRVYTMRRDTAGEWSGERHIDVGGYCRGLACLGNELLVGVSGERRISRSRQTSNPIESGAFSAAIVYVDLTTGSITDRRDLAGFGEEVYDLLPLDETLPLLEAERALTLRIIDTVNLADTIRADYTYDLQRLKVEEQARADAAALAARLTEECTQLGEQLEIERTLVATERAYVSKLKHELQMMEGSRLWHAAQFLRRLAGRPPHRIDLSPPAALHARATEGAPSPPTGHTSRP